MSNHPDGGSQGQHVSRTLRALELLAIRAVTKSEIAAELGVDARTARRLVDRLVLEGYATEVDRRRFQATLKLVTLAGRLLDRSDLVRLALPFVTRLRDATGCTAHLSVPSDGAAVYVIQETGHGSVMVKTRVGDRVPYHSTAVGKALLAYLPDQRDNLATTSLRRMTDRTITDMTLLDAELAGIRERGYAVDDREHSIQLLCVAAPVRDYSRRVVAALGMSALASSLSAPSSTAAIGQQVLSLAQELAEELGFEPESRTTKVGSRAS